MIGVLSVTLKGYYPPKSPQVPVFGTNMQGVSKGLDTLSSMIWKESPYIPVYCQDRQGPYVPVMCYQCLNIWPHSRGVLGDFSLSAHATPWVGHHVEIIREYHLMAFGSRIDNRWFPRYFHRVSTEVFYA